MFLKKISSQKTMKNLFIRRVFIALWFIATLLHIPTVDGQTCNSLVHFLTCVKLILENVRVLLDGQDQMQFILKSVEIAVCWLTIVYRPVFVITTLKIQLAG